MWANWISLVIGIWLFLSGLIPGLQAQGNMIAVGALAIIFGFIAYKSWQGVVNGILGVWIFLSGLWWHLGAPANYIVVGIIMAVAGIWGGLEHTKPHKVTEKTA